MSKTDFGRIVTSLRKESQNELNEIMTQYDLADLAGIPLITLQKIEQGRQANLKPLLVRNIANALNLSSYSRLAFFQASLGLEDRDLYNSKIPQKEIYDEVRGILDQLQTPGAVTNCFGDLLLVNPAFLQVLDLQLEKLNQGHLICKYNLNRIFYSPEFGGLHKLMGESYSTFARRFVLLYKALTISYRNHGYFQKILPELNRYPIFRQHWQSPAFHDEDIYLLSCSFQLAHPHMGPLAFIIFPHRVIAEDASLVLFTCQPLDNQTASACTQMARELGTRPVETGQGEISAHAGNMDQSG